MPVRYDDLISEDAKAKARDWWREIYRVEIEMPVGSKGETIQVPIHYTDADVIQGIREDTQGLKFLFNEDGTPAL